MTGRTSVLYTRWPVGRLGPGWFSNVRDLLNGTQASSHKQRNSRKRST